MLRNIFSVSEKRLYRRVALSLFSNVLFLVGLVFLSLPAQATVFYSGTTPVGGCPPNRICGPDKELADVVFGNPQNFGSAQPPPANRFVQPIPTGLGARPLGMGEAFTALSNDLSGIWYNPAGLVQMETNEIYWFSGDAYSTGPFTGMFAASYMLQNRMVFALSYQRPYHPVGQYPSVIAGTYDFSKWPNPATGVAIDGTKGRPVDFFDIPDTAVQDFLRDAYRYWVNLPFQENIIGVTYATPLSPDRNLTFGINIKYLYQDDEYRADDVLLNKVQGWGADLGFLFRLPLRKYGRELSFGLDIRDIAGQVRFDNGREFTLAPISTVGVAWKTTDPITHSKLNITSDFVYINDPALDSAANKRWFFGGEMFFFNDHIQPRVGYSMFFNRLKSRPTLGISFDYLLGLDYAYHFPTQNDPERHWFSLKWRWGGPTIDVPLPDVNVSVDPPIFSPRSGEFATFTLDAVSDNGIDRWSLNIIDRNNLVVRTYQDRGKPPSQIIWGGEDKTYRLLPDGEYTFLFTATDHLGYSSSTPVQTLKLYTPPPEYVDDEGWDKLRELIKKQELVEEAIDDTVQEISAGLTEAEIERKASNTTLPPRAEDPVAPEPVTPLVQAQAAAGSFNYPTVSRVPFPETVIQAGVDGKKALIVRYISYQDRPKYILQDAAEVVRQSAKDVGMTVARYEIFATYGSREFHIIAPAAVAMSYSRGFIARDQFLRSSLVTLDGSPISPDYR